MKIFNYSDFIFEKMKIMPISNDEFDKISDFPKNIIETGDIAYIDDHYYIFMTHDYFKNNKIYEKLFKKGFNYLHDKSLVSKLQNGLFINDEYGNKNFGYMALDSYDNNLKMINKHTDFDVTLLYRPNIKIDLLDDDSYTDMNLKSIVEDGNGRILFGKIFEKMKIIPISNSELDKVSDNLEIPQILLSYDKNDIENGDVLVSIDKVSNKHINFWLYLSNNEVSRRMDEFLQMRKENKILYDIYSKINKYKETGKSLLISLGSDVFGLFCRSIDDKEMKMIDGNYISSQKNFYKLLKFYGTLIRNKSIYDVIKQMSGDEYGKDNGEFYKKYI